MIAHARDRAPQVEILRVAITAQRILDLRNPQARSLAGVRLAEATSPWQEIVAAGRGRRLGTSGIVQCN